MMLRKVGGSGFNIQHNFAEVVGRIRLAKAQLVQARPVALRAVGVRVLSWALQDFRAKSRGETAGGVKWKPTSEAGLISRARKRKPWKSLQDEKRRLHEEEAPILEELRLVSRRDREGGFQAMRAAAREAYLDKNPDKRKKLDQIKKKRKALREKRRRMIDKEKSGAKTGVDTGRLANSLKFGERQTVGSTSSGTVFQVASTSVTVGSQIEYAEAFDKRRPIFGPGFLDAGRKKQLEEIVVRVQEKAVKAAMV